MTQIPDLEMIEFQEALIRSVKQAASGQYARVHTPEDIARRANPPLDNNGADAATTELRSKVNRAAKTTPPPFS